MPYVLISVVLIGVVIARLAHRRVWESGGWPARAHLTTAWSLVALGIIHVGATAIFFARLSGAALWFASGGIAMALGGLLNVLLRLYAARAPGMMPACLAGNVALTTIAGMFVFLAGGRVVREPQFLLLLSLLVATTALSIAAGPGRHTAK